MMFHIITMYLYCLKVSYHKITNGFQFYYYYSNLFMCFNMFTEKSPTSKRSVGGRGSFKGSVIRLQYNWKQRKNIIALMKILVALLGVTICFMTSAEWYWVAVIVIIAQLAPEIIGNFIPEETKIERK
jgi:hypothetical protein